MLPVLLLTWASGWLLARALTRSLWKLPAWAAALGEASLAVLFGPGLASVLFFVLAIANAARPGAIYGCLGALFTASAAAFWFLREPAPALEKPHGRFPWNWLLLIALGIAGVLLVLDFQAATQGNPNGDWDASSIWNLRARYLAGGPDTWRRAISPSLGGGMTGSSHPGYPLFLSAFLAMQWTIAGSYDPAVPITTSLLVSLAVIALLVTSLAARRRLSLGILAGLVLLATELFASQTASQYSDLLEGLAFLTALVLLDAAKDSPKLLIAAGGAIGFAPWIKNEGIPFAIAAFAVVLWRFRFASLWALLGAAPGFAATAVLKLLSEGRESMFPSTAGEAIAKLTDLSRWWQAFLGFGKAFLDAGPVLAHPALLALALVLVLRLLPADARRDKLWLGIPIAAMLAAEYGLYLVTTANLDWHINTSVTRLLAQVWPSMLWLLFSMLRAPEEYFEAREPIPSATDRPLARVKVRENKIREKKRA
jgi:hypothetical protein